MSSEPGTCELLAVSLEDDDSEPGLETRRDSSGSHLANGGSRTGILSAEGKDALLANGAPNSGTNPEADSGFTASPLDCGVAATSSSSEGTAMCAVHKSELDWFCKLDGKLVCSHCAIVGSCHGHRVTPVARRATDVRNQLVDVCEKIQLQALRIETFVNKTLIAKERALHGESSRVRERLMGQISLVREALEEEEQRLLEEVQREQDRIQQGLLTQRAHWTEALASLTDVRADLVHTLTHMDDSQLAVSGQKIAERVEEAEGVGEPRDTEQLNLDPGCSNSRLLQALWANTILSGPSGQYHCQVPQVSTGVESLRSVLLYGPSGQYHCQVPQVITAVGFLRSVLLSGPSGQYWCQYCCEVPQVSTAVRSLRSVPLSGPSGSPGGLICGHISTASLWKHLLPAQRLRSPQYDLARSPGQPCCDGPSGYPLLGAGELRLSVCTQQAKANLPLRMLTKPETVGVLLDWPGQTLLFYDPESRAVFHTVYHKFTAPLLPACAVADHSITLLH
ncbi:B box and SPRY domain-containing protein [Anguilla rostrata]|uniref:B box and SPRY domain-containing protein n=1 Tax=Anguilla rostrata TaxID=7938 RepID=UPI0030CF8E2C